MGRDAEWNQQSPEARRASPPQAHAGRDGSAAGRQNASEGHPVTVGCAEGISEPAGLALSSEARLARQAPGCQAMSAVKDNWHFTATQISQVLDCASAKLSLEKAAELLDVEPYQLWLFAKRVGLPIFRAWKDLPEHG
jgi:hypothetical protein